MFKVLLVVPYPGLEKIAEKVYMEQFRNENFREDIRVFTAEEIEQATWARDYDLIIGRGHSAAILKEKDPETPVIEIPITGYDIMRALIRAKQQYQSKKIVILVSKTYNHDQEVLSTVSDMEVAVYVVEELRQMSDIVTELKEKGYDTIIGGYSASMTAKAMGISSITIETGEEAVVQVMHEAVHMLETIRIERERTKIYEVITQSSKEGILYVDHSGRVKLANKKLLQMLQNAGNAVHEEPLEAVYPFLMENYRKVMQQKQCIYNVLQNVQDTKLSIDYVPVIVGEKVTGVVITCQSVKKIQQIESQIRKKLSEKGLVANYTFSDMIHESSHMKKTVAVANKFARVSSNILIEGETGTGKELMAQSIHNVSERRGGPFVAVNCAALPENLLESELFGYADGAFTGSRKGGKTGFFEQAHHGTLFLDEISEIPVNFQGKLLRALQEQQIRKIGDDKVIDVDARIIAATNKNLRQEVKEQRFRQDLLYRLEVLKIHIPPLRERTEDIWPIFLKFLKEYNHKFGKDISSCTKDARKLLESYHFEGNIRELRNITERLAVMCEEKEIEGRLMQMALYPEHAFTVGKEHSPDYEKIQEQMTTVQNFQAESEREQIIEALQKAGGRKGTAAEILGVDRSTLWRKMKQYGIQ